MEAIVGSPIHTMHIELTTKCNLDCPFCTRRDMTRGDHTDMPLEEYRRILDQAEQCHVRSLRLYFYGESLLYPHLIEAIELAQDRFEVILCSNGLLLNPRLAERLLTTRLDSLEFSVTGLSDEVYSQYQGMNRNRKVAEVNVNIQRFVAMKRAAGHRVRTTLWYLLDRDTVDEARGFGEFWQDTVDKISFVYKRNMLDDSLARFDTNYSPCPLIGNNLVVMADYNTTICCYDFEGENAIGNLRETDLASIVRSDRLKELVRANENLDIPSLPKLCHQCVQLHSEHGTEFHWHDIAGYRDFVLGLPMGDYTLVGLTPFAKHVYNAMRVFRPDLRHIALVDPGQKGTYFGKRILAQPPVPAAGAPVHVLDFNRNVMALAPEPAGREPGGPEPSPWASYHSPDGLEHGWLCDPRYLQERADALVAAWNAAGKRILVYGLGRHTQLLEEGTRIREANLVGIADANPANQGKLVWGFQVLAPEAIGSARPDVILISSASFQEEIRARLRPMADLGIEVVGLYPAAAGPLPALAC